MLTNPRSFDLGWSGQIQKYAPNRVYNQIEEYDGYSLIYGHSEGKPFWQAIDMRFFKIATALKQLQSSLPRAENTNIEKATRLAQISIGSTSLSPVVFIDDDDDICFEFSDANFCLQLFIDSESTFGFSAITAEKNLFDDEVPLNQAEISRVFSLVQRP